MRRCNRRKQLFELKQRIGAKLARERQRKDNDKEEIDQIVQVLKNEHTSQFLWLNSIVYFPIRRVNIIEER